MKTSVVEGRQGFFENEEFHTACVLLAETYRHSGIEARWTPARDSGYLLIRHRKLAKEGDVSYGVRTDYHIIFSETWQVPVLYFLSTWTKTMDPLNLKEIYSVLVESSTKAALEDVGVMGGISHGDHPLLGIPFYFIHPCRTADLLRDIQEENGKISGAELLQIWLGTIGGTVDIPMASPTVE